MAQEEALKKHGKGNLLTLTGCKDLSGKHPVSGLLELCTRRRWGPPSFSQVRKSSNRYTNQMYSLAPKNHCFIRSNYLL